MAGGALEGGSALAPPRLQRLLLLPALATILLLLVVPLGFVLVYSFLTPGTYGGVVREFSTDAYLQFLFERDLFDESLTFNPAYLQIYARSFLLAAVATASCLLVGVPTAYFIATRPPSRRQAWLLLVTVPYWVNLLIRTVSMLFLIRDEGPINAGLRGLGLIETPLRIAYTDFAVGLGLFYSYLPFMVLPVYAAIERFDFRLVDAAYDLYADRWTILRKVVLPVVRPGIVAGCLLVFIPGIGAFIAPDLLGGGKNLMVGNLIALQFQSSRNWPFGSAAAIILLTIVLLALLAFVRQQGKAHGGGR